VADALQAAACSGKHGMLRDMYEVRHVVVALSLFCARAC
jgi:hypothetical protein